MKQSLADGKQKWTIMIIDDGVSVSSISGTILDRDLLNKAQAQSLSWQDSEI